MRVLIYEPQFFGHNLVHVARLVRALADLPCEAYVATSRHAIESEEFDLHLAGERDRFRLVALDGFEVDPLGRRIRTSGLRGTLQTGDGLRDALRRVRPDHVYVPYGNLLARMGATPGGFGAELRRSGVEAETMIAGGRYLYPSSNPAKQLRRWVTIEAIARGPWSSVFLLDDAVVGQLRQHSPRMQRLVKPLPEPIGERPAIDARAARHGLGLPIDGRLVGVVGLVEPRKGIELLLTALRDAGDRLDASDRLAFVGPIHPDVHRIIDDRFARLRAEGRLAMVDRHLTEWEMASACLAMDVVATVYPGHPYASGLLAAAAAAERPVLGSHGGWIGRTIRQFGLGDTCRPEHQQDVTEQLIASLDGSNAYRRTPAGDRFAEYSGDANYMATWTARLRQRLGLAPSPDQRTWRWALRGDQHVLARAA